MPLLIGTDEAGYGPNLGPLVITAVTWLLPDGLKPAELFDRLSSVISNQADRSGETLHIADSKEVYQAGKSLSGLERGVLAFLKTMNTSPVDVSQLGKFLNGSDFEVGYQALCGNSDLDELSLPVTDCQPKLNQLADRLNEALVDASIQCVRIESRVMFAEEFNDLTDAAGSKGVVLSEATLKLIRTAVDFVRDGVHSHQAKSGWVVCDKHGGRNRYDELISNAFDDELVFRIEESRAKSTYKAADLEFCFRTKAEELMPVALASMVSKYVRELTMKQFNRHWQNLVPGIKPTKGYPTDAARFWREIESFVEETGIQKGTLWRNR